MGHGGGRVEPSTAQCCYMDQLRIKRKDTTGRAPHRSSAFAAIAIIERWKRLGISIAAGPAPRTGALGRMTSIYCEDPDGNLVEVATYSADP